MAEAQQDAANANAGGNDRAEDKAYRLHCFNRNNFNMSLLKYRSFDGFLVTGPHSGTHWIKWMLSHVMAHHYKLDPPKYFNNASSLSNDFIGHPKIPRKYPQLPHIASSHAIAPNLLKQKWFRSLVKVPPYVVVVRDLRDVLISNYEKWKERYNVPFSTYVKGDPHSDKFITDAWYYIRFMNQWGDVAKAFPTETCVLHYEDFVADRDAALTRAAKHLNLPLDASDIAAGAAAGTKEFMAAHHDPSVEAQALRKSKEGQAIYSAEDEAFLKDLIQRHLRHDFGYRFFEQAAWSRAAAKAS